MNFKAIALTSLFASLILGSGIAQGMGVSRRAAEPVYYGTIGGTIAAIVLSPEILETSIKAWEKTLAGQWFSLDFPLYQHPELIAYIVAGMATSTAWNYREKISDLIREFLTQHVE